MKGRINRPEPIRRSALFNKIGDIKIGMKNDKGFPQSLDHFIASGKYASLFEKAYGDKPQTIQIIFMQDNPELECNEHYEYRDNEGKRFAYGDGEIFNVWNRDHYEEYKIEEYPNLMKQIASKYPNRLVRAGKDGWEVTLTLRFIIPKIRGVLGTWQFVTKGNLSTIPNIRDAYDEMLMNKKSVRGIIWDMNVQFVTSQKPGQKSRYPVVSIVPNHSEQNIRMVQDSFQNNPFQNSNIKQIGHEE